MNVERTILDEPDARQGLGLSFLEERQTNLLFRSVCVWLWSMIFYYNHMGIPSVVRPDRWLTVIVFVLAWRGWSNGILARFRMGFLEWAMVGFTVLCFVSLLISGSNQASGYGANTELNEVFNLTVFPFFAYLIVRQMRFSKERLLWFLKFMALIGLYLGLTSVWERYDINSLIWPKYISDMGIGIHQGRSRGPFLQAVFMGFNLSFCLLCCYLLAANSTDTKSVVALHFTSLIIIAGIYFTNTRGAWLGLAIGLFLTSLLRTAVRRISIRINLVLVLAFLCSGASQFSLSGGNLFTKRKNTLEQRELNYRIAFHMGLDHPFTGVGFSRMGFEFDKYMDKHYRGEEWQGWDGNHNEYLGLFAEVGIFACFFYIAILLSLGRACYWVVKHFPLEFEMERALALCALAVVCSFAIISYFNQVRAAPFHICIVFFLCGICASARKAVLLR